MGSQQKSPFCLQKEARHVGEHLVCSMPRRRKKNATVANTKMRCSFPPPPPLPTSVNAQHRQRVMCNSNRVDKDTTVLHLCLSNEIL